MKLIISLLRINSYLPLPHRREKKVDTVEPDETISLQFFQYVIRGAFVSRVKSFVWETTKINKKILALLLIKIYVRFSCEHYFLLTSFVPIERDSTEV